MLGFQSAGLYGRAGLQPLAAWLEFVKLNALAARQVAEDTGVGSVWSWGWGTFSAAGADADKPSAACAYLWARDQSLCDVSALNVPDFDPDLQAGQILLPDALQCSLGDAGVIAARAIDRLATVTGSRDTAATALLARAVQRARAAVAKRDVLGAEALIVRARFRGRRALYRQRLAQQGLSLDVARGIVADEVARKQLFPLVGPVAAWTTAAAQQALDAAVCRRDELPAAGDVKLASWARFLKLTSR
jgi:hypothetical protein